MKKLKLKYVVWAAIAMAVAAGSIVALRGQAIPVETGYPTIQTVRQYIAEDGRTRLGQTYTIDMPITGTVERILLEVGDIVEAGDIVAKLDRYPLEQNIREVEAMIDQAEARVTGVDVAKPKEVDITSASIRVRESEDALQIARKRMAEVEHNLEQARKDFDRAQKLREDGVVSQSFNDEAEVRYKSLAEQRQRNALEIDAAEKALRLSELAHKRLVESIDDNEYQRTEHRSGIEALKAQLALLKHDLLKTEIKSPVGGPVLEKFVENSRFLNAGAELLEIGDLRSIEIECDVLSEEVTQVKPGQNVEILGKALQGKIIEGQVTRVYPSGFMKISALGVEQQRVRTLIAFDNEKANLRPGTSVDVRIITAEAEDSLSVPDRAVFRIEGQWSVFTLDGDTVKLSPVQIGLRNDEWAEITDGLAEGQEIVTEPKNELSDGARISRLND